MSLHLSMQTLITSLIMEGVFERARSQGGRGGRRIRLGAVAWVAPRQDWARMRKSACEAAAVGTMKKHFWQTTQPIEEPETSRDLLDIIRWIGVDRLLSRPTIRIRILTIRDMPSRSSCRKPRKKRSSPADARSLYGLKA